MADKVLYDIELESTKDSNNGKNVLYDFEKEIEERRIQNGIPERTSKKTRGKIHVEDPSNNNEEMNDASAFGNMALDALMEDNAINEDEEKPRLISDYSRTQEDINNDANIFKYGLKGGKFIGSHNCPMCGASPRRRTVSELFGRKRIGFLKFKKIVVGYASICSNCGFVAFYATDVNQLLGYFKGKVIDKEN